MPTMEQLGQLATYLYNYDGTIGAQQDISTLGGTSSFYVLSGQEYSQYGAYGRYFSPTNTGWDNGNRNYSGKLAVCRDQ